MKRHIILALLISAITAAGLSAGEDQWDRGRTSSRAPAGQFRQQPRKQPRQQARKQARVPRSAAEMEALTAGYADLGQGLPLETREQRMAALAGLEVPQLRVPRSTAEMEALESGYAGLGQGLPLETREQRMAALAGLEVPQLRVPRSAAEMEALEAGYADLVQGLPLETREQRLKALEFPIVEEARKRPLRKQLKYMPQGYVTPDMTEAYEQMRPPKTYSYLPEPSWKDYITQKTSALKTGTGNALGYVGRGLGSARSAVSDFGSSVYNRYVGTPRMKRYERAYNPWFNRPQYGNRVSAYDTAYGLTEEQQQPIIDRTAPRYGNRAWELENAYGVPYMERLKSRLPNKPNLPAMPNMSEKAGQVRDWFGAKATSAQEAVSPYFESARARIPSTSKSMRSRMFKAPSAADLERYRMAEELEQMQ